MESRKQGSVLVCVTGQRTCERLIQAGALLAAERSCALSVLHVARNGQRFMGSNDEAEALEYLFQVSRTNGADMSLTHADDVPGTIASFARRCNASVVLIGASGSRSEWAGGFAAALRAALPGVEVRELLAREE